MVLINVRLSPAILGEKLKSKLPGAARAISETEKNTVKNKTIDNFSLIKFCNFILFSLKFSLIFNTKIENFIASKQANRAGMGV